MTFGGHPARTHRALADPNRLTILRLLAGGRALSAAELAEKIGLHVNTVRNHLYRLGEVGLVVRAIEHRGGRGRPRLVYRPALGPDDLKPDHDEGTDPAAADDDEAEPPRADTRHPTGDNGYQLLAAILTAHLAKSNAEPSAAARRAGREWGALAVRSNQADPREPVSAGDAAGRLLQLLDRHGFRPRLGPGRTTVWLHRCPFRRLAEEQADVVCGVHLGLMEGALTGLGAPLEIAELEPFVRPDRCVARLRSSGERPDG